MIPWLVYIWRCVLIRVSQLLSEIRQWAQLIYELHLEGISHGEVAKTERHQTYRSRIYWPVGRYHRSTLLHFRSVKYTLLLALLPLVVWLLIPTRDTDAEPITEVKVKTETIRKIDMRFEDRWFPLYNPPKKVRTIPISVDVDQSARLLVAPDEPLKVAPQPPSLLPQPRPKRSVRYAYRDICTRHNMRRVVTNNGRSWRCRKA
jgi:hypothetical protein